MTISIWINPENINEVIDLITYLENGYSVTSNELLRHSKNYSFFQMPAWAQVQVSNLIYHKLSDFDA